MTEKDCAGNTEVPRCYKSAEEALANKDKAADAYKFRVDSYYLCETDNDIKYALMNYGPVLAGVMWRNDFTIVDNVVIFNKKSSGGGHAIMIYGWNSKGWLI